MLRGIRKASSNWVGKIIMGTVMGVLILSFAVWGIADIFRGFGQSTLAKVGDTEISTEQFRQIYTDRLQQIGRQFGRPLTQDQARAFGLDRQVLQQVIAEAALDENARRLGLGQSDADTMRTILSDPNFKGTNGAFDPARFQQAIRQFGYSEQRYLAEQHKVALRRQIAGTILDGLEPSKTQLEAMSRYQDEQRSIAYLKLGAAQVGTIEPPSSEALAGYYDEHKAQFRAPEYRKVSFVAVTPEAIATWSDVSDADAKKVFEERREQLATPEKREISQIVFPNGEEAQAARTRLDGGLSFADLAKERGLKPSDVDLGLISKSEMLDPAVANAAFALPADGISQPIKGRFGTVLVKIGKIEPGIQPSYESVAQKIKREIAIDRARAKVQDLHNKMEDARGGGASVIEAAKQLGLTPVTIDAIDRSGRGPDGQPVAAIPKGLDLATAAFASDVGVDNETLALNGGYVWFDVLGVTPSRERPLDEVKDQVEARWREAQVTSRLRTKAAEIVQKLGPNGKLADAATAAGVKLETATGLKRETTAPGVPASVIAAAFRTAKDGISQTQGDGGEEWFVFQVTDIVVPQVDMASEEVKKLKETLIRRMGDEQVGQYIARLENQIGTTINETAVAQVTGAATN
ncbi:MULTISPECIES: SurA N-terminal domain-containing protein [Rhodopseudomonas]|uniref:Parvulin-like PPIase n=1 Tax=Rhodopseudomonas palustris TaxID=1076 RepID=A0A0D7ERP4_RHOPL|nr:MULTISPECIES: SurA N-terminal domain-containing protein [Rhodopseudomonas]KIZ43463.1 peptidylprolyl isomerase [Rhodopseudomonas palustris]MDF3809202.1 SurA N-terminal domain-containing protein [Rhodopseudomonas sp. BAL398]WOK19112.1 SurA N-terminal domain-containing protein [Rhodopseudomonas sp. BAL398]